MITYQEDLYNNLIALCESNDAFYFVDQEIDGIKFRIFSYRLASYTDFLQPGALECRGVMFELGIDDVPLLLSALPPQKFFNLNENPMTMELDLSQIEQVMLKADGSLISSYIAPGAKLGLKSKTALQSDQAVDSLTWLNRPENATMKKELTQLTECGCTANMEWCSPENRIVVGYMEPSLTILNVRNTMTGEYQDIHSDTFAYLYPALSEMVIPQVDVMTLDPLEWVEAARQESGIEGYVVRLKDGTWFKLKNEWYVTQHRAKDSIHVPRRLYEAVLEEATDDLRTLFFDDPLVLKRIGEMELFVEHKYNSMVATVERFFAENKGLDRKDYAIKGGKELPKLYFGLAMSLYVGREVNFKEFMRTKWKAFGVKDEENTDD